MSFKAVFEVFLQIHQFTNIDLPCQGIFRLRTSVYQKLTHKIIHGEPFDFMSENDSILSKKFPKSSIIEPPYFYTKAGIIKYSDEILQFNDKIRFKLEIESFPRLHSEVIFLQVELLYQEIAYSLPKDSQQGEPVDKKIFRFQNLEHGLCNYCEGEYVGNYSSKFSFTVFGCLSNFQFGKYKLMSQIQTVWKEGEGGKIIADSDGKKNNQNVRAKELQRSRVKNFEQFLGWVDKYYKDRINNSLLYFYNTYVKNLRYYFYLAQQKLDQNSLIKQVKILKVPKQFLDLPDSKNSLETEVNEKQFRNYMQKYEPKNISAIKILSEINTIYSDIYMFLVEVEKQIKHGQLMKNKMSRLFQGYIKDRYGERVFKSVVRGKDKGGNLRENKKIAKKMRQKQVISTVSYPIEDTAFTQSKQAMQFIFYQITYPQQTQQSPPKKQVKTPKRNIINSQTGSQKPLSKILDEEQSQQQIKIEKKQKKIEKQGIYRNKEEECKQSVVGNGNMEVESDFDIIDKGEQKLEKIQQKINFKESQSINVKEQNNQKQVKTGQEIKIQNTFEHKQPVFNSLAEQIQYLREQDRKQKQQKMAKLNKKQKEQGKSNQQQDEDSSQQNNIFQGAQNSDQAQKSFQNHSFTNSQQEQSNLSQVFNGISDIELTNPEPPSQIQNYKEQNMLIVMCHGFQGSSFDMSLILRGLKQVLPNACYLLSRCNEGETEGDIEDMGKRVAQEVNKYVRNYMDKNQVILNFIGHSMGGIVARTAVKYLMKEYYHQFGFFSSLSSPHLGYLNGVDGMIKAGLWAILKFKPIKSLQQLKMDDQKELRKSFLYKLSKQGNLKRFRKLILFSSFEDSYVSWNSARITAHTSKSSKSAKLEQEMVANILGSAPIHRIDVNFNVQTKNLDSFIGRTAHINLIIQQSLFKIINSTIPELFDLKVRKQ